MQKAIYVENTGKIVERILSVAPPEVLETNPTGTSYILIDDFPEAPELQSNMCINYPMYNTQTQEIIWVQIDYQYTATNELLEIENLKAENRTLNEIVNMLIEAQADIIGGAIQ